MSEQLKIFVSYRREDCMIHAGRLAENLTWRAGAEVFLDVESIPLGVSFPEWIDKEVARCDAMLVVIGNEWLTIVGRTGDPASRTPPTGFTSRFSRRSNAGCSRFPCW